MKRHATFDIESAKRIAAATRTVEGMGKTLGGGTGYTPVLGGGGRGGSTVRVVRITGKYSTAAGGKYLAEVYPMSSTSDDAWTDTTDVIPGDMLGTPTQDAIFMNVIEYGIGGSDYLAWDDVTDTDNIYGVGVVVGTISGGTYDGYLKIAGIAFKPNVCTE